MRDREEFTGNVWIARDLDAGPVQQLTIRRNGEECRERQREGGVRHAAVTFENLSCLAQAVDGDWDALDIKVDNSGA